MPEGQNREGQSMPKRMLVWGLLAALLVTVGVSLAVLAPPKIEPRRTEQVEVRSLFSGDSGKITQPFHIPSNKWRISYAVQASDNSFFKFVVYNNGSGLPLTEIPDLYTTESSYVDVNSGPGDYYLVITSSLARWEITVTSISD